MHRTKIIFYPKDINPYQELLRKSIIPNPKYFIKYGESILPLNLIFYKLKGYTVFHLHWLYPFQFAIFRKYKKLSKVVSTLYLVVFLTWLKVLNYKIVYTIHDIISHEEQFISEILATKITVFLSDSVIIHSNTIKGELKKINISNKNIHVIPHGNYINYYKNTVSKKEAREKLNVPDKDIIILFFGMIKDYKGIDKILEAFSQIYRPNMKLMIAGQCIDQTLLNLINDYKKKLNGNLICNLSHIPNNDVQYYFNSADLVVSAFKELTTSGSMLLALSFGKPILCPRIGSLKGLPNDIGILYDPEDKKGLTKSLKNALVSPKLLMSLSNNALSFSKKISWGVIGKKTIDLYNGL